MWCEQKKIIYNVSSYYTEYLHHTAFYHDNYLILYTSHIVISPECVPSFFCLLLSRPMCIVMFYFLKSLIIFFGCASIQFHFIFFPLFLYHHCLNIYTLPYLLIISFYLFMRLPNINQLFLLITNKYMIRIRRNKRIERSCKL